MNSRVSNLIIKFKKSIDVTYQTHAAVLAVSRSWGTARTGMRRIIETLFYQPQVGAVRRPPYLCLPNMVIYLAFYAKY